MGEDSELSGWEEPKPNEARATEDGIDAFIPPTPGDASPREATWPAPFSAVPSNSLGPPCLAMQTRRPRPPLHLPPDATALETLVARLTPSRCHCGTWPPPVKAEEGDAAAPGTLRGLTAAFTRPFAHQHGSPPGIPLPLGCPTILTRRDHGNTLTTIDWKALLSRDATRIPPRLSLAASQQETLAALQGHPLQLMRRWDIDSLFLRPLSLAFFKGGFEIGLKPPYHGHLGQDPWIRVAGFRGCHRFKHMRLGRGRQSPGPGYDCHIFFPHLGAPAAHPEPALSHAQLAFWLDHILFPSVHGLPADFLQHWPANSQDVFRRATARTAETLQGSAGGTSWDLIYTIHPDHLATVWASIQARCNRDEPPFRPFRNCFLLVSAHNLKLSLKAPSLARARARLMAALDSAFHLDDPALHDAADSWLDCAYEDIVVGPPERPLTLLLRTSCLADWGAALADPASGAAAHTHVTRYHWATTAEAASLTVTPSAKHSLSPALSHCKSYASHKEIMATPAKNVTAFENPRLDALTFTQESLDEFYRAANAADSGAATSTHARDLRAKVVASYEQVKRRVANALAASRTRSYGYRRELRLNLDAVLAMTLEESAEVMTLPVQVDDLPGPPGSAEDPGHWPFWILETATVNDFVAANCNRFLALFEVLARSADLSHHRWRAVSRTQQLTNAFMAQAALQAASYALGSAHLSRHSRFWRARYQAHGDQEAPDSLGLDFRGGIEDLNYLMLPTALVDWHYPPVLSAAFLDQLPYQSPQFASHVAHAAARTISFRATTSRNRDLRAHIQAQLASDLQPHRPEDLVRILRTPLELIVQSLIQTVLREATRGLNPAPPRGLDLAQHLGAVDAAGLGGLSYDLVARLYRAAGCSCTPFISKLSPRGAINFPALTGLWWDRLGGLFDWEDLPAPPAGWRHRPRRRQWDGHHFRTLTRETFQMVQEEIPELDKAAYLAALMTIASEKIWILPNYDLDKFQNLRKSQAQNALTTRQAMEGLTRLERCKWNVPQIHPSLHQDYRFTNDPNRPAPVAPSERRKAARVRSALRTRDVRATRVCDNQNNRPVPANAILYPGHLGVLTPLEAAQAYLS